jgi:hypothetical protein
LLGSWSTMAASNHLLAAPASIHRNGSGQQERCQPTCRPHQHKHVAPDIRQAQSKSCTFNVIRLRLSSSQRVLHMSVSAEAAHMHGCSAATGRHQSSCRATVARSTQT